MSDHTHSRYVEGCYRCDLSRDEVGGIITEEMVERGADTLLDALDQHGHNGIQCRPDAGMDLYVAAAFRAALSAVAPDIIRQAKAEALREAEPVLQTMLEYGAAIRGDWSDFDGRTMRAVIDDWVRQIRTPDPSHTVEWHRMDLGLCMAGGGHWCRRWGYCDDECGCEPCAAERGGRDE